MKIDRSRIFEVLEPPPGGAARLHARLNEKPRRGAVHAWWLGPAVVVAVAVVTIAVIGRKPTSDAGLDTGPDGNSLMAAAEFDRLLRRESVPYELTVRRGDEALAVTEIESSNPSVRLYSFTERSGAGAADDP